MKRLLLCWMVSATCAIADTPVVTNMSPVSGTFTNRSSPITFRWQFGSSSHSPQKTYQVLIGTPGFSATNYDSGPISSPATQHVASVESLFDGIYDWKVRVTDQNDDPAESTPWLLGLDNTWPDQPWYNTAPEIFVGTTNQLLDIDFFDNVRLSRVEYLVDEPGTFYTIASNIWSASYTNDWTLTASWANLSEGMHTLNFRITDCAGHVTQPSQSFKFYKDRWAPSAPTFNTAERQWFQSSPSLDIDFSDIVRLQRIEYRADASTNWSVLASGLGSHSYTPDWKPDAVWPALSNGIHFLYFRVTDYANWSYVTPDPVAAFEIRKGVPPPDADWPSNAFFRIAAATNSQITSFQGTNLTFVAAAAVPAYEVEFADALAGGASQAMSLMQAGGGGAASNVVPLRLGQAALYAGMEAFYPMTGNANDRSGHDRHATVAGATFAPSFLSTSDQACRFDGSDDRLYVPDSADLRLAQGDFTLAAWVYEERRNAGAADTILGKRGDGSANGWYLGIAGVTSPETPGKVVFMLSSDTDPRLVSTCTVGLSNWTHVAVTYQSSNQAARLYVNGVPDSTAAGLAGPSPLATNGMEMGAMAEADPRALKGALDEVRVYRRALSSNEVWQLYGHLP